MKNFLHMKINLDRLHKTPKTKPGEGKTIDTIMQIVGTIEVLEANRIQQIHTVPVWGGYHLKSTVFFIDTLLDILTQRNIKFEKQNNLTLKIGNFIRVKFFVGFGSEIASLRGCRCTQPIFDPDCGLVEWQITNIKNNLYPNIY